MNYTTQAIEGLDKLARGLANRLLTENLSEEVATLFPMDIRVLLNLKKELNDSVKFLLPKDANVGISSITQEVMDLVRMPYPKIVLEYEATSIAIEGNAPSPKRVVLLNEETFDGKLGMRVTVLYEATGVWLVVAVSAFIAYNARIDAANTSTVSRLPLLAGIIMDISQSSRISLNDCLNMQLTDIREELGNSIKALACINAKNVKHVEIEAPEKLNKKRLRNGKPPFFAYKILDIFLGETVISVRPKDRMKLAQQLKSSVKLHSVRGHFKVRKNGIFWWSSFIRGKAAQGISNKDYRLT